MKKSLGKGEIRDPETGKMRIIDFDDDTNGVTLTYKEFMERNSGQKIFSRSDFDEDEEEEWIRYEERMGLK